MTTNTDGAMPELPVALYHHAEADGTFLPSESCVCEDDVYTNNGDDETIGVPLVRLSDARAAIQQAAGAVPEGCRIVPMEPSKAMLDRAVAFALNVSIGGSYGWTDYMRDLYARMLSAVPSKAGSSVHLGGGEGGGVTQWRSIETAPRDGLLILGRAATASDPAISTSGFWAHAYPDGVDEMGHDGGFIDCSYEVFTPGRSFGAESYQTDGFQPTHWKPFPTPPEGNSK